MRGKLATVAVLTVAVAACSAEGTPATTPPSVPTTSTVVTTTVSPATTTTTTVATTTTLERLTQIEAIFQDLEERRLQALYEGDREAFRDLFANPEYMERSMVLFDIVEFESAPSEIAVEVAEVVADGTRCIAARVFTDATNALGPEGVGERTIILETTGDRWGFSYIGEGWACDGLHPLSS